MFLLTYLFMNAAIFLSLPGHQVTAEHTGDYGTVIGIDFGTTYSCVGVYRSGRVEIIPNDQGNRITPSWVGFSTEERLIGDIAKQAFHTIPSQTVFDVKRLIGRQFSEAALQEDIRHWPFQVVENLGKPVVRVNYRGKQRDFTPQEIAAMILAKMKETAEMYLGVPVTQAVVTVPAYFNDAQRQATRDAGTIAGLNILRIINEPTAAAIAYGLDKQTDEDSKLIVYDLGGGTFDVSLLNVSKGVFEVLAVSGDTHLGGEDFDNRVIEYLVEKYERQSSTSISSNKRAMSKLKREVEKAKRTLSSQLTARLEIESFEGGNDFSFLLTRAKFEELNLDLFQRTMQPVRQALQDANIDASEIDDIILVGGSTRIPKVRELLQDFFGGKSPKMGINPDEAVAYGAAIQAAILSGTGSSESPLLIDVCPLTLGIETTGGVFSPLIPRNSPIPVQKSEIFSTATDNQRAVLIKVFQGEHAFTKDNVPLGNFELSGIPPAARGVPQIEVTFEVDSDGIMKVTAQDKASGGSESVTIVADQVHLNSNDLGRMAQEAVEFALNDKAHRKHNLVLNELQRYISNAKGRFSSAPKSDVYLKLIAHAYWAELDGRFASIEELEERLADVKSLAESIESRGGETSALPGDGLETQLVKVDLAVIPHEDL